MSGEDTENRVKRSKRPGYQAMFWTFRFPEAMATRRPGWCLNGECRRWASHSGVDNKEGRPQLGGYVVLWGRPGDPLPQFQSQE